MKSAEGERESFNAGIEKPDLELPINCTRRLPDQLTHPWLRDRTVAVVSKWTF